MAHGAPDWHKYRTTSSTYSIEDLAELAARLGSIVTFDRRGDVIFLESFEHGRGRWDQTLSGTGAAVALEPAIFRTSGYSIRLTPGTDQSKSALILGVMHPPRTSSIGFEFSFTTPNLFNQILAFLQFYDGTTQTLAWLRYYLPATTLDILTAPATYTTVATGITFAATAYNWYTLKLVADLTNVTYSRAIFGNVSYPLTDYDLVTSADSTSPQFQFGIALEGTGSANLHAYIDDIILTQDEP